MVLKQKTAVILFWNYTNWSVFLHRQIYLHLVLHHYCTFLEFLAFAIPRIRRKGSLLFGLETDIKVTKKIALMILPIYRDIISFAAFVETFLVSCLLCERYLFQLTGRPEPYSKNGYLENCKRTQLGYQSQRHCFRSKKHKLRIRKINGHKPKNLLFGG